MATYFYQGIKSTTRYWWLLLVGGLILLLIGLWIIAQPARSYITLSMAFALTILMTGLLEILFATFNAAAIKGWGWILISGLIDVAIGSYLYDHPAITMSILPFIVGLWLLFRGLMAIGSSFDMKAHGFEDWAWLTIVGLAVVLLGIAVLINPVFGIINLVIGTGAAFIAAGLFRVFLSFKLRKIKKEINHQA